jgi:hypothetical protein
MASKKKTPEYVPECPAFDVCRAHGENCKTCLKLDVASWKQHVFEVVESTSLAEVCVPVAQEM